MKSILLQQLACLTLAPLLLLLAAGPSTAAEHSSDDSGRERIVVTVLTMPGCLATPPTIRLVRETARELGVDIHLEVTVVQTPTEAKRLRFLGSPTVQVQGVDIDPAVRQATFFGLT